MTTVNRNTSSLSAPTVNGSHAAAWSVSGGWQEQDPEFRFTVLAQTIPMLLWVAQPNGSWEYVNERWCAYTGLTLEQSCGLDWMTALHPDDRHPTYLVWQAAIARGDRYEVEYRIQHAKGHYRWFLTRGLPLKNDAGEVMRWFGTCTDIDDQKRLETALTHSNKQLQQFAYTVSHDFQEPLRAIGGYVQLLARRWQGRLDAEAEEFIGYAVGGVRHMERMILDLLAYSRVHQEELTPTPVSLQTAVEEGTAKLQLGMEEAGAQVTCDALPTVSGEGQQISLLFQHLLANALKFRRPEVPLRVHISAQQNGSEWVVCVHDNGLGFHPKEAERIFGVFKRLHRDEYPGTGMGLALARRIVERHGGRIWAEGRPGDGATICFTMPVHNPDQFGS